ncbi:MAG: hypothetical protein LIO53_00250 [Oscillospiraceae bacterium]|nr:hypothetical protein [Oscillospiraceae bacterium]
MDIKIFSAKNPKQLDLCLRMLYSEHMVFSVRVVETDKKKIAYEIQVNADNNTAEMLKEKYRILIS